MLKLPFRRYSTPAVGPNSIHTPADAFRTIHVTDASFFDSAPGAQRTDAKHVKTHRNGVSIAAGDHEWMIQYHKTKYLGCNLVNENKRDGVTGRSSLSGHKQVVALCLPHYRCRALARLPPFGPAISLFIPSDWKALVASVSTLLSLYSSPRHCRLTASDRATSGTCRTDHWFGTRRFRSVKLDD